MSTEDNATGSRVAAFERSTRTEALEKYPELSRAYNLKDASAHFAREHFAASKETQDRFARLTDRYIRKQLIAGQPLPKLDREHDLERQRTAAIQNRDASLDR